MRWKYITVRRKKLVGFLSYLESSGKASLLRWAEIERAREVVWGQNQGARTVSAKALRQSHAHHTPAISRRPVWPRCGEQGIGDGLRREARGMVVCSPGDHCILFLVRRETFGEFSAKDWHDFTSSIKDSVRCYVERFGVETGRPGRKSSWLGPEVAAENSRSSQTLIHFGGRTDWICWWTDVGNGRNRGNKRGHGVSLEHLEAWSCHFFRWKREERERERKEAQKFHLDVTH